MIHVAPEIIHFSKKVLLVLVYNLSKTSHLLPKNMVEMHASTPPPYIVDIDDDADNIGTWFEWTDSTVASVNHELTETGEA